ncbi:MAG: hypothetical protein ACK4Z6_04975 [Candidatus Methylomirabilales bacterium]
MKKLFALGLLALAVPTLVLGGAFPVPAQADHPAITFYEGKVTQVDPSFWSLTIESDKGVVRTFRVAHYGDLGRVALGDTVLAQVAMNYNGGVVLFLKKLPPASQVGL